MQTRGDSEVFSTSTGTKNMLKSGSLSKAF